MRRHLESCPRNGRGELTRIAQYLMVHPSLLTQIQNGTTSLTVDQGFSFAKYLGLMPVETDYLLAMISMERAGTKDLKEYFQEKMSFLKSKGADLVTRLVKDKTLTDSEKAVFYSSWKYSAVRLYCSLGGGKTLREISELMEIPLEEAVQILEFLLESGLCTKEGERYKLGAQRTHLEKGSPFLLRHITNWHLKAIESADRKNDDHLIFSAPLSISKDDFLLLREELNSFTKRMYDIAKNSEAENVAVINLDLFWLA